jgi:NAD(P)-dependent dehydrogenase (short-subunit alcohol dehydrogenase family)
MTKIDFDEPSTGQVNPPKFTAALTIAAQGDGAIGVIGETTTNGGGAEFRNFIKSFRPMQRMGTPSDVANVGEYRAGDLAAFVSGQHLVVTGGTPA